MNWLHYLVEANLYLGVFYLVYYLFLSEQTWYSLNRVYLLVTSVLAFIIPFIQLGFLKPAGPVPANIVLLPPVQNMVAKVINIVPKTSEFSWQDGIIYLYLAGAALLLTAFLLKIYQLFRLAKVEHANTGDQYKLVYIDGSNTAFSFFNFLFIGTDTQKTDTIINHELVHITQKHSADILFIELLKIVNWFNPFVYLLQYSLKAIHEYIADEQTAMMESDTIAYSTFLVNNAYGLSGSSITHSFFNYNLLKKRIIMLNQKRSGKLARLRYLIAIPVCLGLLCASTLAFSKSYGLIELLPNKIDSALKPRYDVWNKSYDHTFITPKGYKVRERVIFIDGAVSKKVEIFDNDGQVEQYEARFVSAVECKFLKDQYGYQFPVDTVLSVKLLPPPEPKSPMPAVKQLPAPPPASKVPTVKQIPPPPPAPVKPVKLVLPKTGAPTIKFIKFVPVPQPVPGMFAEEKKAC